MPPTLVKGGVGGEIERIVVGGPEVIINNGGGFGEGDMLPIVQVAPDYPAIMAARGLEGWVLVEFTVDELGRVQDATIVEAQPKRGFERAALNAVKRYKYKPRVVNGSAVRVSGVKHRITFELS